MEAALRAWFEASEARRLPTGPSAFFSRGAVRAAVMTYMPALDTRMPGLDTRGTPGLVGVRGIPGLETR